MDTLTVVSIDLWAAELWRCLTAMVAELLASPGSTAECSR
ncbi:hypothetical protein HaLaN_15845 [Haematococcus lacustris]|uniref:Uncharacterized protein n=1 Tax=Haematococcus lacustris TaxID=44745 RepID=A0A699Z9X6_HAELA|nr:hypothetical protein HaLaN_15845 [Haematococcus lacustris]